MTCAEQQDKGTDVHGRCCGDCRRSQVVFIDFARIRAEWNPQLTEADFQRAWLVIAVTSLILKRRFGLG